MSVDLFIWVYETLCNVVLHTPLFLFDTEWFSKNILMFTGLSIGAVVLMSIYEGYKRLLSNIIKKQPPHTDMGRISSRFPLVILGSGLAPVAFYYGFKGINYVTATILDINTAQLKNSAPEMALSNFNESFVQTIMYIGFDIALIGFLIPILFQNVRRWFDLFACGTLTPLALSCWMFKQHEHYFHKWWNHIKKCSMTQLVYAGYLLILSGVMFGLSSPSTDKEFLIKIGIIIGGFSRLTSLPKFVSSQIDNSNGVNKTWEDAKKAVTPHPLLKKGVQLFTKIKRK